MQDMHVRLQKLLDAIPEGCIRMVEDDNDDDRRAGFNRHSEINKDEIKKHSPGEQEKIHQAINGHHHDHLFNLDSFDVLLESVEHYKRKAQEVLKRYDLPDRDGVWIKREDTWQPAGGARAHASFGERGDTLQALAASKRGRAAEPYRAYNLLRACDDALRLLPAVHGRAEQYKCDGSLLVRAINHMVAVVEAHARLEFQQDAARAVYAHNKSLDGANTGRRAATRLSSEKLAKAVREFRAAQQTEPTLKVGTWARRSGAAEQFGVQPDTLAKRLRPHLRKLAADPGQMPS